MKLVFDTDVVSAFAKAGHFEILIKLFEVCITPKVYEELLIPLKYGYDYPKEIFEKAELITLTEEEQMEYLRLLEDESIGKGEAESLTVCKSRGFLFTSFDKRAVQVARSMGVWVVVVGAIFSALIEKGIATRAEVLKIVKDIEEADNRVLKITF